MEFTTIPHSVNASTNSFLPRWTGWPSRSHGNSNGASSRMGPRRSIPLVWIRRFLPVSCTCPVDRPVHRKTAHTTISDHFAATIVQAIEALGREGINDAVRTRISSLRSAAEFRKIVKDTRSVTAWIHDEIMTIAALAETHEAQS